MENFIRSNNQRLPNAINHEPSSHPENQNKRAPNFLVSAAKFITTRSPPRLRNLPKGCANSSRVYSNPLSTLYSRAGKIIFSSCIARARYSLSACVCSSHPSSI